MRPLICGTVRVRGVSLPVIDCRSWRVWHGEAECDRGLPLECEICPQRESREGNMTSPPIVGRGTAPSVPKPVLHNPPLTTPSSTDAPTTALRGLGDAVKAVTTALGFTRGCGGCMRRQETLNRLVPFPSKEERPPRT